MLDYKRNILVDSHNEYIQADILIFLEMYVCL